MLVVEVHRVIPDIIFKGFTENIFGIISVLFSSRIPNATHRHLDGLTNIDSKLGWCNRLSDCHSSLQQHLIFSHILNDLGKSSEDMWLFFFILIGEYLLVGQFLCNNRSKEVQNIQNLSFGRNKYWWWIPVIIRTKYSGALLK